MKTKVSKYLNIIIRSLIIVATIGFLVYQLFFKKNIVELFNDLVAKTDATFFYFYLIVVLLMPLNWLLEAAKWRFLISPKEKISLFTSLKAVFAGVSISSLSPNRVGEYFGRIFVLKKTGFWQAVVMTVLGSISQTMVTFVFGTNAIFLVLIYFAKTYEVINSTYLIWLYVFSLLIILAVFLAYLNIERAGRWFKSLNSKYLKYLNVLAVYSKNDLLKVFGISLLRYFVFSTQFYLTLLAFGIDLNIFLLYAIIFSIFLLNTILPTIAIFEIGVRGSISLAVFTFFYSSFKAELIPPDIEVVLASTIVWFTNLIVPSVIGLFFIKDIRFFKNKNEQK
jgi:uncharacterized membrane protein YbhN (UPF0104 family)